MTEVSRTIHNDEILVRFIYDKNFKKKKPLLGNLIIGEIFLPYKGGVSLQRSLFCSERACKIFAKKNTSRIFIGFLIFTKQQFEDLKAEYSIDEREHFDAIIKSTPLNENFQYVDDDEVIFTESLGNPAHCDLVYLNPAVSGEESTKTAIRSFSRKLAKKCKLLIDPNPEEIDYNGLEFK